MADRSAHDVVIRTALDSAGVSYERTAEGSFLVSIPGEHRLKTMTWFVAGQHALLVEAFFMRKPDENAGAFYQWLMGRNSRLYGVAFSCDRIGDVYLVGRLSLDSISEAEIDKLLGSVLEAADGCFNPALEIGFASSIRREWEWRAKRGESTRNLEAFARFADPERGSASGPSAAVE